MGKLTALTQAALASIVSRPAYRLVIDSPSSPFACPTTSATVYMVNRCAPWLIASRALLMNQRRREWRSTLAWRAPSSRCQSRGAVGAARTPS